MIALQTLATRVLAEIIRRQPSSAARTTFAWEIVAGPALARTTAACLQDDVLILRPRDQRWVCELERARSTILERMQHLLGDTAVTRIEIAVPH